MSYKIVRKDEATFYEAPGHYDMRPTRLHNPQDVNDGKMIMGLSHFLPGGGCTKTTLHAGDSFHCGPFTKKGIQNNGSVTCQMLVCLVPPEQK